MVRWLKRLMRRKRKYKNLEDWLVDLKKLSDNPDDDVLVSSIKRKVLNSEDKLKDEIKNYLVERSLFNDNPIDAFKIIIKDHPNSILLLKSAEDPWFVV